MVLQLLKRLTVPDRTTGAASRHVTGYDLVRVLIGVVLLSAAITKGYSGYSLTTRPTVESDWFLFATVVLELLLGVWLISGAFRPMSWTVSMTCFTCYACVSLHKALAGEASCGCFGKLVVNPWLTLAFNVAVLCVLLYWRPARGDGALWNRRTWALSTLPAISIALGFAIYDYRPVWSDNTNIFHRISSRSPRETEWVDRVVSGITANYKIIERVDASFKSTRLTKGIKEQRQSGTARKPGTIINLQLPREDFHGEYYLRGENMTHKQSFDLLGNRSTQWLLLLDGTWTQYVETMTANDGVRSLAWIRRQDQMPDLTDVDLRDLASPCIRLRLVDILLSERTG
jgi:hypothetical protein